MKKIFFIISIFIFEFTNFNFFKINALDGLIFPFREMTVSSKISAPVKNILVKEGQLVNKNTVLLEFDDFKIIQEMQREQIEFEKLNIDFSKLLSGKNKDEIKKMEIGLEISKIKHSELEEDLKNLKIMLDKNGISQREYELKKNEYNISKLSIEKTDIDIKIMKDYPDTSDIKIFEKNIELKKLAIQNLNEKLSNKSLRTDFSGIIKDILVNEGDFISEGGKFAILIDISSVFAEVNAPVSSLSKYAIGSKIKIFAPLLKLA